MRRKYVVITTKLKYCKDIISLCDMQLDLNNEWLILADRLPWEKMEAAYVAMFPSKTAHLTCPFRFALGFSAKYF